MKNTVLVIGAGAAGLIAARTLANAGKIVTVLEARNRTGGRIHTLNDESFFKNTELGAEFIHGDLPVTLNLLKEANIAARSANAEMWTYRDGKFEEDAMMIADWDLLIKKLDDLEDDTSIYDFLQEEFPGEKYAGLRKSVYSFVSGYDTADPRDASAFALREEWQHDDQNAQHRVSGGYCTIINYLAHQCKQKGGQVLLNAIVKEIEWQRGHVKAVTADGITYEAERLVMAAPLGVLKAAANQRAAIRFVPALEEHNIALQKMGFGAVIKLLFAFKAPFWLDAQSREMAGYNIDKMGYLFSEEEIPTWWTQVSDSSNVLTGWIGGPKAAEKKDTPTEEIMRQGLQSLATIFNRSFDDLKGQLIAYRVMNWTADPFCLGSYAYDMVGTAEARKFLNTPLEDTIYFAGEYLYDGTAMGTVEAALASGEETAKTLLNAADQ